VRSYLGSRRRSILALAAIALLAIGVGAALVIPSVRDGSRSGEVSSPVQTGAARERAAQYLIRSQNRDGGFGGERAQPSAQVPTAWVALGLAATGRDPHSVSRGGPSITEYLRENTPSPTDAAALERSILVARAAGVSPHKLRQRDSYRNLLGQRARNGSFENLVNLTAFGVLAMRAAGEPQDSDRVRLSVTWLGSQQNSDGGFGFSPRPSTSDIDDTAATLQALAVGGQRRGVTVDRAVDYLLRAQRSDGGFGQTSGQTSNAQSTSWAVQGLVAVGGERTATTVRDALSFLRSLQASDGSLRYSQQSNQTPVWVTGQALLALARQPLPVQDPNPRP
jgi:prenyltransferase beta subunit